MSDIEKKIEELIAKAAKATDAPAAMQFAQAALNAAQAAHTLSAIVWHKS